MSATRDKPKITTLTIRIKKDSKTNLDDATYRVGFTRMKEGESR